MDKPAPKKNFTKPFNLSPYVQKKWKKQYQRLNQYSREDQIFLISGILLFSSIFLGSLGLLIVSVIAGIFIFDVLSGHIIRKKLPFIDPTLNSDDNYPKPH